MKKYDGLIAKFMGYEIRIIGYCGTKEETKWQVKNKALLDSLGIESIGKYAINLSTGDWWYYEELKYSTSWDILMPVIQKIFKLNDVNGLPGYLSEIMEAVVYVDIQTLYEIVVKFIKWYNAQTKTT